MHEIIQQMFYVAAYFKYHSTTKCNNKLLKAQLTQVVTWGAGQWAMPTEAR